MIDHINRFSIIGNFQNEVLECNDEFLFKNILTNASEIFDVYSQRKKSFLI